MLAPRDLPQVSIINGLGCQTCLQGSFDPQRLFGVVLNLCETLRQAPEVTAALRVPERSPGSP